MQIKARNKYNESIMIEYTHVKGLDVGTMPTYIYHFLYFLSMKCQHVEVQGQYFFNYFSYFIRFCLEIISVTSLGH